MKKALLLSILIVFGLLTAPLFAGGEKEAAEKGAKVTIDFMGLGNELTQNLYKDLVEAFNTKQDKVFVNYMPHPEGGWEKVRTMFAGKQATDCIRMDDDDVYDFARMAMITNIDPYIDKDLVRKDYFDATWTALNVDGKAYSCNVAFGTNAFLYNKKMFAEAGVTAPDNMV